MVRRHLRLAPAIVRRCGEPHRALVVLSGVEGAGLVPLGIRAFFFLGCALPSMFTLIFTPHVYIVSLPGSSSYVLKDGDLRKEVELERLSCAGGAGLSGRTYLLRRSRRLL